MIYRTLFVEFFKAGLFAVGGGLATLPFLREMAVNYPWFSVQELTDMIAVSESTPGPIGVNMAACRLPCSRCSRWDYGYSVFSTALSRYYYNYFIFHGTLSRVLNGSAGFYAVRAATAGLIAGAMFDVFLLSFFNLSVFQKTHQFLDLFQWQPILVFACFIFLIRRLPKVHHAVFILAGAVLGVVLQF